MMVIYRTPDTLPVATPWRQSLRLLQSPSGAWYLYLWGVFGTLPSFSLPCQNVARPGLVWVITTAESSRGQWLRHVQMKVICHTLPIPRLLILNPSAPFSSIVHESWMGGGIELCFGSLVSCNPSFSWVPYVSEASLELLSYPSLP